MRRFWLALLLIGVLFAGPALGQPTGPLTLPQPIIFTGGTASGIGGSTFAAEFSGPVTLDAGAVFTVNGTFAGTNAPVATSSDLTFTGNDTFQTGTLTLNNSGSLILKQTTANYTLQWTNPTGARTLTFPDNGNSDATDTFVFLNASQVLTSKTLKEATGRADGVQVSGGATANPATVNLNCTGTDANVNCNIVSKGTGLIQHNGTTAANSPAAQAFTASGTYTTPATATALWVRCVGGGGGGGGALATASGGGGAAGGYTEGIIAAPAASYTVTIGAAGSAGGAGTAGGAGGTTTWGAVLTANGGGGGSNNATGGTGGTASGGLVNLSGASGMNGQNQVSGSINGIGGMGGVSPFGGAGNEGAEGGNGAAAQANTGSGGGGGGNNGGGTSTGGAGGSGLCLVVAF